MGAFFVKNFNKITVNMIKNVDNVHNFVEN